MLLLVVTLSIANMFLAVVVCLPLADPGPHLAHSWGQLVRLTHLYSARPGVHLLISEDGQIHGSAHQTPYSKSDILKHRLNKLRTVMSEGGLMNV